MNIKDKQIIDTLRSLKNGNQASLCKNDEDDEDDEDDGNGKNEVDTRKRKLKMISKRHDVLSNELKGKFNELRELVGCDNVDKGSIINAAIRKITKINRADRIKNIIILRQKRNDIIRKLNLLKNNPNINTNNLDVNKNVINNIKDVKNNNNNNNVKDIKNNMEIKNNNDIDMVNEKDDNDKDMRIEIDDRFSKLEKNLDFVKLDNYETQRYVLDYEELLSDVSVPSSVLNRNGRVLYANDQFRKIVGLTQTQLKKHSFFQKLSKDNMMRLRLLQNYKISCFEIHKKYKDNIYFVSRFSYSSPNFVYEILLRRME